MKYYLYNYFSKSLNFFILFISIININSIKLNAEENYLIDMEIDNSTKSEESSVLPTNPFEIVEMIRRANSMNDATKPSDAIDAALSSFDKIVKEDL